MPGCGVKVGEEKLSEYDTGKGATERVSSSMSEAGRVKIISTFYNP